MQAIDKIMSMNILQLRRSFKEQMHQAREQAIIIAASRLMGEKGFEAMTVDEVASAAGIAKASLYKHFAGKEELCAAAMVHAVERANQFLSGLDAALAPYERLKALLRWMLELQFTDEMPLMLSRNSGLAAALLACEPYQEALGRLRACVQGWVEEAQQAGEISRELPSDVVVCALFARASDPLLTMLRDRASYSDPQIVDWAMQTCLAGLAARP
ncbi:TetR/AcrR family transcriptional regulator [uncultured Stenotrophomonas sp.]|uniref:TetR/AcrR family transcriptional regulator n=1 Tax=uncultured Stenotrophomonas sp. TaxID=165438 RepID=UPI0025EFF41C|nr:TetR/AcrR family transcriptional regulator [uncultured Stenotrophomonas sp.]